jgi:murein DD-endopeptidase MepM/ murein hydrolase activator NlpD
MRSGIASSNHFSRGYTSIGGALSLRRRHSRGRLLQKNVTEFFHRFFDPGRLAVHRRVYLDGAVLGIVLLAATSTVLVRGAQSAGTHNVAASGPALATTTRPRPVSALSAKSDPTPRSVLPPAVQAITEPKKIASTASSDTSKSVPPVMADPAERLIAAAPAPVSAEPTEKGRLSRAQALPEIPRAAGPQGSSAASPNGASAQASPSQNSSPATVNTLDSQYVEHTIINGETLSSIADKYGLSVSNIVVNNPGLGDLDVIHPGQTLRIPSQRGLVYNVQAGDTLDGISRRYGIPLDDVLKLPANGLADADVIKPGQTLLLPGDIKPPPPPPPVLAKALPAAPQVVLQPPSSPPSNSSSAAAPAPAPAPAAAAAPAVVVGRFIWPISGPLTQGFGVPELGYGAPHTGIDIGLYGRDGTPIGAAAPGTVSFSGGSPCCGYGYYVIVKHAGGFETLYGHLSRRYVSVGDTVAAGQPVGEAGSTGFSTGTHLHFEIHLNGALQNPLKYLP